MLEIRAIIRPTKLEALRDALRALPDFPGLSVVKIEGFTAPKFVSKQSIADELREYSPKLMLYVVASCEMSEVIIQTIVRHCSTGQTGDGLVWTTALTSLTKIKDGAKMNSGVNP